MDKEEIIIGTKKEKEKEKMAMYINALKSRISETQKEIKVLKDEANLLEKETASHSAYQARHEALAEEIKELQGELGDLNTFLDQLHTNAELRDINNLCEKLKSINEQNAFTADEIFRQRKQAENELNTLQTKYEKILKDAEDSIQKLDDSSQSMYFMLKKRNQEFLNEISQKQAEIKQVVLKYQQLSEQFPDDAWKRQALEVIIKIMEEKEVQNNLQETLKMLETDNRPEEQDRLLKKIDEDMSDISGMEVRMKEFNEIKSTLTEQLSQIEALSEEFDKKGRATKYEELFKRDKEMDEFLNSFETTKAEIIQKISELQKADSNGTSVSSTQDSIPDNSTTGNAVMQRLLQMEAKIKSEHLKLNERDIFLNQELELFDKIDLKKQEQEMTNKELAIQVAATREHLKAIKSRTLKLESICQQKEQSLKSNDTHNQLDILETKLKNLQKISESMKSDLDAKKTQSDYNSAVIKLNKIVDDYNVLLIKKLEMQI